MTTQNRNKAQLAMELLTKNIFGTFYIETTKWTFKNNDEKIGRTYFADRMKRDIPFDDTAIDNMMLLYRIAMDGRSAYQVEKIISRLINCSDEYLGTDLGYLLFQGDDTDILRTYKVQSILAILSFTLSCLKNRDSFDHTRYRKGITELLQNTKTRIRSVCEGTFTETLMDSRHLSLPIPQSLHKEEQDTYNGLFSRGKILFFFKSSLTCAERFVQELRYTIPEDQYSYAIELTTDPDYIDASDEYVPPYRYITDETYDRLLSGNEILPFQSIDDTRNGLWISDIEDKLSHGIHVIIPGNLYCYKNLPFDKTDIMPFLLLADKPSAIRRSARRRGTNEYSVIQRLKNLQDILNDPEITGLNILPAHTFLQHQQIQNLYSIMESIILASRFRANSRNPYSAALLNELNKIHFEDKVAEMKRYRSSRSSFDTYDEEEE